LATIEDVQGLSKNYGSWCFIAEQARHESEKDCAYEGELMPKHSNKPSRFLRGFSGVLARRDCIVLGQRV
jgi:hypothetical protein